MNDSTGKYHQDLPTADLSQIGHYQYKWVSTGTGAGVSYSEFDVFDPFDVLLLPLQDAKDELSIPQATTAYDNKIQAKIDTIEAGLERFTGGPIINRQITERVEVTNFYTTFVVRKRPLVSVQSITVISSGQAVSISDLDLDSNACVIRRKMSLPFILFWGPYATITYTAGWGTAAPAAFNQAARIILKHQWESQRGPSARPNMEDGEQVVPLPNSGIAVPLRALELLSPYGLEAYV